MSSNTAFLVGFMGSGKSSILNILKLNTEIHTIDLDDIVLKESKDDLESIEQLFEKHGEEYFRDCEVKAFQKIYQNPNTVISLGGGSMISSPIKSEVLKSEHTFYLKNEFENLWKNIEDSKRPLVSSGKDNVMKIYLERLDTYKHCKNTIDMTIHSLQEASEIIINRLGWI
jgi:shikimate kinase